MLLAILRVVDFKCTAKDALAGPRFHQQWQPDVLRIEETVPQLVRDALEKRGHKLQVVKHIGVSQAVVQDAEGNFTGASDPRIKGRASGF